MNAFTVRSAARADVPAVIELVREFARFERLVGPDDAAAARFAADFEAARFQLLVAELGGALRGYALSFFTYSTFLARPSLFLEDLFVQPEARRLGVGRAFLGELARRAVEAGCGRFEWAVLDWNTGAQAFYVELGAEILPDWRTCRVDGDALAALAAR